MRKIIWIEYAKVMAAILVVLQHSISQDWAQLEGKNWELLNLIFMLTRMGVPIFLMCSGIGMLSKERDMRSIFTKSVWNILKTYIGWMLVYGVFDAISLYKSELATCRTVCNVFLKNILFGRYHTWFLATLVGLYLITPLLYRIVIDNKMTVYYIFLSVLFSIIFPCMGRCDARINEVLQETNMNFVTGYVTYFIIGCYIDRINISKKMKAWSITIWIAAVVLGMLISTLYANFYGQDSQRIYSEFSIIGFTMNVSFMVLIKACFGRISARSAVTQYVMKIRNHGYGIYLVHPLLLSFVPADKFQGAWSILKAVIIYCCALGVVAGLHRVHKSIQKCTRKKY